jgi:hypothetical protein
LQQLQIKSSQDRRTINYPTLSAFSSFILYGEVDSSIFFIKPIFEKPFSQLLQENVTVPLVQARGI